MLAPMPDTTSNNKTANTVFCVLAIGTSVLLLRPNRTTYNSRERTATQKAPKPTFAQGVAPWPTSPVSLNPQNKDNYSRLIMVWMPHFRESRRVRQAHGRVHNRLTVSGNAGG
jgi:hypothetical protein